MSGKINDLQIVIESGNPDKFPVDFKVKLPDSREIYFQKIKKDETYSLGSSDVYTVNSEKQVVKFDKLKNHEEFELYRENNGSSFATLIRNQEFVLTNSGHPFRMVKLIEVLNSIKNNFVIIWLSCKSWVQSIKLVR